MASVRRLLLVGAAALAAGIAPAYADMFGGASGSGGSMPTPAGSINATISTEAGTSAAATRNSSAEDGSADRDTGDASETASSGQDTGAGANAAASGSMDTPAGGAGVSVGAGTGGANASDAVSGAVGTVKGVGAEARRTVGSSTLAPLSLPVGATGSAAASSSAGTGSANTGHSDAAGQ